MTNEYGLLKIHEQELEMLKVLDDFCRRHDIEYMLDAGTLIGAIREHGFIPWDDDVDIIMTRDNWEKLDSLIRDELPDTMKMLLPEDLAENNKFYDYANRIIFTTTQRRDEDAKAVFYDGLLNHLWIDIFVYDNIPDNKVKAHLRIAVQKILYALSLAYKDSKFRQTNLGERIALLPFIAVGKLIPLKKICEWKRKWSVKDYNDNTKKYFVSNYPPDWFNVWYDKDWYKEIIRVPFEDTELPVPSGYHEVLTVGYGDYMKRPDEKDRVSSHDTSLKV